MSDSVTEQVDRASPEWFEAVYAEADGDASRVPWADKHPHAALVNWLNAIGPSLVRCGARVAVVGCGLGEDARELMRRGYDVTAFDCSPTAIAWARKIDPENAETYHEADVLNLPERWHHRFDLVVEINTVQAMAPELRPRVIGAIGQLVAPHGYLLVICRHAEGPVQRDTGPPWPLSVEALERATLAAGLVAEGPISTFDDEAVPAVSRMRAVFRPD